VIPRVDIGGLWLILTLIGFVVGYLIACHDDKRQAREREDMRRAAGVWRERE
jgi:hypothetical protein